MKKIILFTLVALSSCALFAGPKSNRVELKIWESSGPEKNFVMYAVREYKKIKPNVRIVYEPVESTAARSKIELDGPAGVGADIFVCPHDHIGALVAGGHILPVENAGEYMANFYPMARTAATYNGIIYGYPLGAETYALFYNKDIIKDPPKTWEEIIAFAKKWNNKFENKYAIAWPVDDPYYAYMFLDSFGAPLFGPEGDNPKLHNLNTDQAVAGLTYMQSLKEKVLNVPAMDCSLDFVNTGFTTGNVPLAINGPWKIKEYKTLGINFGITTLPAFPGTNKPATSFSGIRLAFVSSYSQYPEEAIEFVKFLTSKEMLQKRLEITDQIPPRNDVLITDPYSKGIQEQLKYAKPMPTINQISGYWTSMGAVFSEVWDGGDVKKTLAPAIRNIEAMR